MARVPQISQQAPQPASFQAQGVVPYQNQAGQQLQQLAGAATNVGNAIFKKSEELRVKNDTARTSEADQMFGEFVRNELNPKSGYRSHLGKSAGDTYEQVLESLQAKRSEFAQGLQNPDQREMFNRASSARLSQARGVVDMHAAQQTNVYLGAQQSAAIKGYQADYLGNLGHPKAMLTSMANMQNTINAQADLVQATPEVRAQMMTDAVSGLHASALQMLLTDRDTGGAQLYLDINKDEIDPVELSKVTAQLDALTRNQDMADLADHIIGNAPEGSTLAQKRQYALDTAEWTVKGKNMSAEDGALLYSHLNQRYSQAKEKKAVTNTTLIEQAQQQVAQLGTNVLTSDLPIYKDLVANNLVTEFDKLRRSTGIQSRSLSNLMFDLSKGEIVTGRDGTKYKASEMTTSQMQDIINSYGGATEDLTAQYYGIVYDANIELQSQDKDDAKRVMDLRRKKVESSAMAMLTNDERNSLGMTRSANISEEDLLKKESAALRKDRFVDMLLRKVPINKNLNNENAVVEYETAIDKAVLDTPSRSESVYNAFFMGWHTDYNPMLPEDRDKDTPAWLRIDEDGDSQTERTWVSSGVYAADDLVAARGVLEEIWVRSVLPAEEGETDEAYGKRIIPWLDKHQVDKPQYSDRDVIEFIERSKSDESQRNLDEQQSLEAPEAKNLSTAWSRSHAGRQR